MSTLRVAYLATYLRELAHCAREQGKIVKIDGNPVEVIAVALLSGSIAVAQMMGEDLKALAGNAKGNAKIALRPALEQVTARGAELLINKIFGEK